MKDRTRYFTFHGVVAILTAVLLVTACTPPRRPAPTPLVFPTEEGAAVPATGQTLSVTVRDQEFHGDTVVIEEAFSDGPGWIAIHNEENGQLGPAIGHAPVKDGVNKNITVPVDPAKVTPTMYAMLHIDAGKVGEYEFPGADVPAEVNGQGIHPAFAARPMGQGGVDLTAASIKIQDQDITDGEVIVEEVVLEAGGWVDIHIENADKKPGRHIGFTAVKPGTSHNVRVIVDSNAATPVLYAMLHIDAGEIGTYESPNGADVSIKIDGQVVQLPFSVTGAKGSVGPATTGSATGTPAAEASASTPESPAAGSTPTAGSAGEVAVTEPASEATESPGEQGSASGTVPSIRLVDQPIVEGQIQVEEVVSDGDAWLVIHRRNGDGTLGAVVGFTKVQNGVNSDVVVEVDTSLTSTIMHAMLYKDLGNIGRLEIPDPDVAETVNGNTLAPSFAIIAGSPGDVTVKVSKSTQSVARLVDGRERTLYVFLRDEPGRSNCTGDCLKTWQPLLATGRIIAASSIPQSKLGVLLLPDGSRQVTYSGSPLYTYVGDVNPDDLKGQGIDGLWFIVTP